MRTLDYRQARELIQRRASSLDVSMRAVEPIMRQVRERGDSALVEFARQFDGFDRDSFQVPARGQLTPEMLSAANRSAENIREFAQLQLPRDWFIDCPDGRRLGQIVRPLESVGVYVPGGRYPLVSTLLMTAIPAQVAGVSAITVVCPHPSPEILGVAALLGFADVLQLGGAHAIAALAFGTETIAKVDCIVGPGSAYVAAAKKLVAGEVAIDFIAGPSEIVIIASSGDPRWIAADLLAQAEHDVHASAILLTTSTELAECVSREVERQLETLPTAATARASIELNGAVIVVDSLERAVDISNAMAPEHLCLHDPELLPSVRHAGSVFLGPWSPEAAGDYASGPNHVLPTAGSARMYGGLSSANFVKAISVQSLSPGALSSLAPAITALARAEGLEAHARSVEVRLSRGSRRLHRGQSRSEGLRNRVPGPCEHKQGRRPLRQMTLGPPFATKAARPPRPGPPANLFAGVERGAVPVLGLRGPGADWIGAVRGPNPIEQSGAAGPAPNEAGASISGTRAIGALGPAPTMVSPRPAVRKMEPYHPPAEGRSKKLRLDLNENAVGCSPRVTAMLAQRITEERLATYPEYEEAISDLSACFRVGESEFLLTNGADEAIQLLIHTYVDAGDSVILLRPSYTMYRFYGELAGAKIVEIPYSTAGFEFPAAALLSALTPETRVVLIANPNNPAGTLADVSALDRILKAAPQAAVLVDEAYYEFSRVTMLDRIREYPNLFIARTFSKVYGLAGMRCGCLFSASGNVDWLRKAQSPYSVNILAAMAIRTAIQDVDHLNRCVEEALSARALLYEGLTRLGVPYIPSAANFVLFEAGERAGEIQERLSERGVLVRGWSREIPDHLRVTVGTGPQIRRFLQELEAAWTR